MAARPRHSLLWRLDPGSSYNNCALLHDDPDTAQARSRARQLVHSVAPLKVQTRLSGLVSSLINGTSAQIPLLPDTSASREPAGFRVWKVRLPTQPRRDPSYSVSVPADTGLRLPLRIRMPVNTGVFVGMIFVLELKTRMSTTIAQHQRPVKFPRIAP